MIITCLVFRTEIGESDDLVPGGDRRHHREATVLAAGDQCENSVSHDVLNFQKVMVIKVHFQKFASCAVSSAPCRFVLISWVESDLPQVFHIMSLDGASNWI